MFRQLVNLHTCGFSTSASSTASCLLSDSEVLLFHALISKWDHRNLVIALICSGSARSATSREIICVSAGTSKSAQTHTKTDRHAHTRILTNRKLKNYSKCGDGNDDVASAQRRIAQSRWYWTTLSLNVANVEWNEREKNVVRPLLAVPFRSFLSCVVLLLLSIFDRPRAIDASAMLSMSSDAKFTEWHLQSRSNQ